MAIYHNEIKIITRGEGRSACAAAAYMSCSRIYNEYDGVQHDYTRKQGRIWEHVFLPPMAPEAWKDRELLWNAVEAEEKTKDSRLGREHVVALPVELNREQWIALLTDYIQSQFVAEGMCADVAIHDPDGTNPHAHIITTVRPLNPNGTWQYKTEKEYLCVRDGEERGFTAAEFQAAKTEGWEKQYPYKVGKKKVYMAPSVAEAQGFERANKYPKSTKYGRQNPISARWNSEEQLVAWRAAWADIVNTHLERAGCAERIDHRSHADRGLDEHPTIHEGYQARAMEKRGFISDRCEINRQIKADNALVRALKKELQAFKQMTGTAVTVIAEKFERLRGMLLLLFYQRNVNAERRDKTKKYVDFYAPLLKRFEAVKQKIRTKTKERKALFAEKDALSPVHILRRQQLSASIATCTEDIEEAKSEKARLLQKMACADDAAASTLQSEVKAATAQLVKFDDAQKTNEAQREKLLQDYDALVQQAASLDPLELAAARDQYRAGQEQAIREKIQESLDGQFSEKHFQQARKDTAAAFSEDDSPLPLKEQIEQARRKEQEKQNGLSAKAKQKKNSVIR